MKREYATPATASKPVLRLSLIRMQVVLLAMAWMCAWGRRRGSNRHRRHRKLPAELQQARSLADAGGATQAEALVRQFLQGHEDSAEGHFLLGYILFREIQTEARAKGTMRYGVDASLAQFRDAHAKASLAEFTEGAKYHEPTAFDLKIVAEDYVLLDDFADADKWMTRVTEWNPKDSDAWYNLGTNKVHGEQVRGGDSRFRAVPEA